MSVGKGGLAPSIKVNKDLEELNLLEYSRIGDKGTKE
jgi:hypothetical protein